MPQPHVVFALVSRVSYRRVCFVCACARMRAPLRVRFIAAPDKLTFAERRVISMFISRRVLLSADKRLLTECEGGSGRMLMEVAAPGAAAEGFSSLISANRRRRS